MEDTLIRATVNGGIALLTLGLIGLFVARWLIPFIERALNAHATTVQTVVTSHEARQTQLVDSFRDTNEALTRAHHDTVKAVVSGIGRDMSSVLEDMSAIRGDMDRIADALVASGIEATGRTRKVTPTGQWSARQRPRQPERDPEKRRSGVFHAESSQTPDGSDDSGAGR